MFCRIGSNIVGALPVRYWATLTVFERMRQDTRKRMRNALADLYPAIGNRLPILSLAELPTPVSARTVSVGDRMRRLLIKHDDVTGPLYGGNKVRKLEYLFARARRRAASRIATFGAVGSNHAVATAIYARACGFECTCFLSHQSLKPGLGRALRLHQSLGTEILRLAPAGPARIAQFRKYLQGRSVWVVPLGGSSWLGSVGFVNAGVELARQIDAGEIPSPSRIYVALGTMGTAVGLALGLALAGIEAEVQAVRVTAREFANEDAAARLMKKCASLMHRYDPSIPADLADRTRFVCRNEFFGAGYGRSNEATEAAIAFAGEKLGLGLESTYSGKTMAALLSDLRCGGPDDVMFWNTWNSRPLDIDESLPPDFDVIPREFARYFG